VALIVLDASVLIALLDPCDTLHTAACAALARHAGDDLKLSASAYAESMGWAGPPRPLATAKGALAALLLDIVPITGDVAEEAAALRVRHPGVRLVVATGSVLGAVVVRRRPLAAARSGDQGSLRRRRPGGTQWHTVTGEQKRRLAAAWSNTPSYRFEHRSAAPRIDRHERT
jgi:hypothetical protein